MPSARRIRSIALLRGVPARRPARPEQHAVGRCLGDPDVDRLARRRAAAGGRRRPGPRTGRPGRRGAAGGTATRAAPRSGPRRRPRGSIRPAPSAHSHGLAIRCTSTRNGASRRSAARSAGRERCARQPPGAVAAQQRRSPRRPRTRWRPPRRPGTAGRTGEARARAARTSASTGTPSTISSSSIVLARRLGVGSGGVRRRASAHMVTARGRPACRRLRHGPRGSHYHHGDAHLHRCLRQGAGVRAPRAAQGRPRARPRSPTSACSRARRCRSSRWRAPGGSCSAPTTTSA